MIYEVTQDILDLIKPFSSLNTDLFLRHYDEAWSKKDKKIRTDKLYFSSSKFNESAFVTFKVKEKCKCSWPSAYGTFEFIYEVYFSKMEKKYYVYITALIYKQKCKRHGRYAEPKMTDEDLTILCKGFWTHLTAELHLTDLYAEK